MSGYACDGCRHFEGDYPREKYTTIDGAEWTIAIDYCKCRAYKRARVVRKVKKGEYCGGYEGVRQWKCTNARM